MTHPALFSSGHSVNLPPCFISVLSAPLQWTGLHHSGAGAPSDPVFPQLSSCALNGVGPSPSRPSPSQGHAGPSDKSQAAHSLYCFLYHSLAPTGGAHVVSSSALSSPARRLPLTGGSCFCPADSCCLSSGNFHLRNTLPTFNPSGSNGAVPMALPSFRLILWCRLSQSEVPFLSCEDPL